MHSVFSAAQLLCLGQAAASVPSVAIMPGATRKLFRPTRAASVPSSTHQAVAGQPCMIANIAVDSLSKFPGASCRPGQERWAVGRVGGLGRHP